MTRRKKLCTNPRRTKRFNRQTFHYRFTVVPEKIEQTKQMLKVRGIKVRTYCSAVCQECHVYVDKLVKEEG